MARARHSAAIPTKCLKTNIAFTDLVIDDQIESFAKNGTTAPMPNGKM